MVRLLRQFSMEDISKELRALGLVFFIYYLSWGAIRPFFSIYFERITGTYSATGILIGSLFMIQVLIQTPLGDLLDKVGRKKMIGVGTLISSTLFFGLFVVKSLAITFVLTLLLGIGVSMISPAVEGLITKLGKGHEGETTGTYQSIRSLGQGIGPIVAGVVAEIYTLSHAFLICGLLLLGIFPVLSRMKT
ncbi:MAG: MFS transporter [Candidatus Aenigmatarchaeota archaeon]